MSGLSDVWETCYGSVTISHMKTGKAESRAVRGHILAFAALHFLLLQELFNRQAISEQLRQELDELYSDMLNKSFILPDGDECTPDCIKKLHDNLVELKQEFFGGSRTGWFWLQYMDYVKILLDFIRADRKM